MTLTVTITRIRRVNGRVYVRFASKREKVFESLEEFQAYVSDIDEETLEKIALMLVRVRQPDLSNPAAIEGRGVRVDLTANNWGTLV